MLATTTVAVVIALGATGPGGPASATTSPETFSWCSGALLADLDRWLDGTGIPSVFGWSYVTTNGHSAALRVDGTTVYSSPRVAPALAIDLKSITVDPPSASGVIVQQAGAVARITTTVQGLEVGGCCYLKTDVVVENIDTIDHFFEWRWFHDTAFDYFANCLPTPDPDVDGGEICLPGQVVGSCEKVEFDGLARDAIGCGKPVTFYSADTNLPAPTYVVDDTVNRPVIAELLFWEAFATQPNRVWSGMVTGEIFAGCDGDSAILLIWRLPEGSGTLAAGESARLSYSIGQACEPLCCPPGAPAEVGNTLWLVRRDPRIEASWAPAGLAETYTVRRSDSRDYSAPVDDVAGISTTSTFLDVTGVSTRYWRVRGVSCAGVPGPE